MFYNVTIVSRLFHAIRVVHNLFQSWSIEGWQKQDIKFSLREHLFVTQSFVFKKQPRKADQETVAALQSKCNYKIQKYSTWAFMTGSA